MGVYSTGENPSQFLWPRVARGICILIPCYVSPVMEDLGISQSPVTQGLLLLGQKKYGVHVQP